VWFNVSWVNVGSKTDEKSLSEPTTKVVFLLVKEKQQRLDRWVKNFEARILFQDFNSIGVANHQSQSELATASKFQNIVLAIQLWSANKLMLLEFQAKSACNFSIRKIPNAMFASTRIWINTLIEFQFALLNKSNWIQRCGLHLVQILKCSSSKALPGSSLIKLFYEFPDFDFE